MATYRTFGVAGGSISQNGVLDKLGFPKNTFIASQFPENPCYEWGSPGWSATAYNLFMYRKADNISAFQSKFSETPSISGSHVIFGNEPDSVGADNMPPTTGAGGAAKWFHDTIAALPSPTYSYKTIMPSVSQSPTVSWTPRSDNPYVTGHSPFIANDPKRRYMWDLLCNYHDPVESGGYGVELPCDYRNCHLYGGLWGGTGYPIPTSTSSFSS